MRTNRAVPVLALALLVLAGCAAEPEPAETTPASTTEGAPDGQDGDAGDGTGAADDAEETEADEAEHGDAGNATAGLELTTSSGTTSLAPTEVYCSGRPGELHHLIGKTGHQPPIVEITPGEFATVKLGEGRPYKSLSPEGVAVGDESVTFDETALGDATLTGTLACTDWED